MCSSISTRETASSIRTTHYATVRISAFVQRRASPSTSTRIPTRASYTRAWPPATPSSGPTSISTGLTECALQQPHQPVISRSLYSLYLWCIRRGIHICNVGIDLNGTVILITAQDIRFNMLTVSSREPLNSSEL